MSRLGLALGLLALLSAGSAEGGRERPDRLFGRVVQALATEHCDAEFRQYVLPGLAEDHAARDAEARTAAQQRESVRRFLSLIPHSHLMLCSRTAWQRMEADVVGDAYPMFGMMLEQRDGRWFAAAVLDGGPAAQEGIRTGDEVLTVDGASPGNSTVVDWPVQDAAMGGRTLHGLLVPEAGYLAFRIRARSAGGAFLYPQETITVAAGEYSLQDASEASIRVEEVGGRKVLYVHLWMVVHMHSAQLLAEALARHPQAEGLVLDLRGAGGSAAECARILQVIELSVQATGMPLVAVVDGDTRSAKEILAHEIQRRKLGRLVGRRTAGALLAASFVPVGPEEMLMVPHARLGALSAAIEGKGVRPDVELRWDRATGGLDLPRVESLREVVRLLEKR
ncbi:MAG: hypothetical protein RIT25_1610 [Planctomycetota bacterium]